MLQSTIARKFIIEALGVFMLVFFGGMAGTYRTDPISLALSNGIPLLLMITVGFDISGGHFNPAITLGLFLTYRCSKENLILYILA